MTVPARIVDNDANEERKLLFGDLLQRLVYAENVLGARQLACASIAGPPAGHS